MKSPPPALTFSWIGLLVLLGLTVTLAYQPLGAFNSPIALTIAALKTVIVAAVFMELRERRPLMLAFAGAGICWLAVLMWLSSTDFTRRPGFPPTLAIPSQASGQAGTGSGTRTEP
jgi:cytochrome c oxidase subunit 4